MYVIYGFAYMNYVKTNRLSISNPNFEKKRLKNGLVNFLSIYYLSFFFPEVYNSITLRSGVL